MRVSPRHPLYLWPLNAAPSFFKFLVFAGAAGFVATCPSATPPSCRRAAGRYPELGREGRLAWVRKGRHEDLEAGAAIRTGGDAFVMVLHGSVSIEQGDTLLSAQGPIVIETDTSVRVVAKTPMRVVHVPPMASATPAPTGS